MQLKAHLFSNKKFDCMFANGANKDIESPGQLH